MDWNLQDPAPLTGWKRAAIMGALLLADVAAWGVALALLADVFKAGA